MSEEHSEESGTSPKGHATIPDVARRAGVSTATAARALGDYGSVSERARERVRAAAEELGYRRNELARTMITGRSNTIALLIADIDNPYFSALTHGVSAVVREAGCDLVLAITDEDLEVERSATKVLLSKRVDGIIVAPASADESDHLRAAQDAGCPVVLVDRHIPGFAADAVVVDNRTASRELVRRLVGAGHKRIAMVTGAPHPDAPEPRPRVITAGQDRLQGFRDGLEEAGLTGSLRTGALDPESARVLTLELLDGDPRPTAIYASDSRVAMGVLKALREREVVVPDEISLVSFDDADWTAVVTPPLSVIAQPVVTLGRRAAETLLARIAGDDAEPGLETLQTEFVSRASIAQASS